MLAARSIVVYANDRSYSGQVRSRSSVSDCSYCFERSGVVFWELGVLVYQEEQDDGLRMSAEETYWSTIYSPYRQCQACSTA
jgi:hypothetical protein